MDSKPGISTLTFLFDDSDVDGLEGLSCAAAYIQHVSTELTREPREWSRHQTERRTRLHRRVPAHGHQGRRTVGASRPRDRLQQDTVGISQMPDQLSLRTELLHTASLELNTHLFNGSFSRTTRVSRYQKGETNLMDFTEVRDSEWQWHQPGHMQVCTSLQTDNHASTSPLSFYTGRMPFLPPNQQRQSTEGT